MRVLLDECLPRKLKYELPGHSVATVPEMGWAGKKNGALLHLAETVFDVFITADQNVQFQQNLHSTALGIVVLVAPSTRLEALRPLMAQVHQALPNLKPGDLLRYTV